MLFNSISFAVFLPVVFALYWFVANKSVKQQNILLLMASYFFYACWDWRFLFLLLFSTLLDYFTGLKIYETRKKHLKKTWICVSIIINVGILCFFKYYNFFIGSFEQALSHFGMQSSFWMLHIILPVGISFYTFHGVSYVIDIYRNKIEAEKSFINYAVFVCFFPLLVAGPIERAWHLLPQVKMKRFFNYEKAVDGLRQILWGLFKKIVIADNCAVHANEIFTHANSYSGSALLLGAVFFAFQIYGDFSGYSDIALGTARLFGIELLQNFSFPYFSRDIAEFWRRWHISLSSWFRDYLYIPMGGSRGSNYTRIRNVFVVFAVSGFWHGANWTFIVWGILNALYFIPLLLTNRNRSNLQIVAKGKVIPTAKDVYHMLITFGLTLIAWIFFRSVDVHHAILYIHNMFSADIFSLPRIPEMKHALLTLLFIVFFMIIEWLGRENKYAIEHFGCKWKQRFRYGFYYALIIAIFWFAGEQQQFIYFQF